jgi:HK97 family phage major capsid protein
MASMGEAVGSEGGFAVPDQFVSAWLDTGLESEVVRPRATVYPMTSESISIPAWDDSSHAANTIAGFRSYWQAELSALTESSGKLRAIQVKAEKNVAYCQVSNELLSDSPTVAAQIERKAGEAVSFILDTAFISGSGAGQPHGILNDPAVALVAKETVPAAQPADTICLENLVKMYSRMYSGGHKRAAWLTNYNCLPELYRMSNRILNAAGNDWVGGSQSGLVNVAADGSMTILGRPVIASEKLPTLGDRGCLCFVDLSQYLVFIRQDIRAESSRDAGFGSDSTYFRIVTRVNGLGSWAAPLTPKVGAGTLSWIVVLDTV